MNAKMVALFSVCVLAFMPFLFLSEDSEGANLPDADMTFEVVNATYYTNTSTVSFWLSDIDGDDADVCATLIGGSNMQGNLVVDKSGAPSWITYELFSSRYDVKINISPGAVCNDTFWILFKCFENSWGSTPCHILLTFDIQVINNGSVIPDENLKTYTLKFDSAGGSRVGTITAQSTINNYTFNLKDVKDPSREGYKFVGWSTDKSGNTVLVSDNYKLTITDSSKTASATLYAVWEKSDDKLIIFTVWDDIMILLSEPYVIVFLIVVMLALALFVRSRGGF